MNLQVETRRCWTVGPLVFLLLALVVAQSPARAQESHQDGRVSQVETYMVRAGDSNTSGDVPPLTQPSTGDVEIIRPTEMYLVPVDGPNLTGEIPPLDKTKAIPLHAQDDAVAQSITLQGFTPGQWYDHYTYYSLDGTEVEQYTNFKETTVGQYIELQRWENNNGGTNRFVYDGWTGSTHNWFNTWLSSSPTLSPSTEYTEGFGTQLQTYFRTNSSSCPCWLSDYRVGDH